MCQKPKHLPRSAVNNYDSFDVPQRSRLRIQFTFPRGFYARDATRKRAVLATETWLAGWLGGWVAGWHMLALYRYG